MRSPKLSKTIHQSDRTIESDDLYFDLILIDSISDLIYASMITIIIIVVPQWSVS